MKFDAKAIQKIAGALQTEAKQRGNNFRMVLDHPESGRRLSLEIYPDIAIGKKNGSLISVYTPSSHLQLHFCTGYVVSESLGEVTFVAENKGKVCGLIIEKEAGCSLFANVDARVLSGDFTKLGPEVMLSGIALSLTENILPKPRTARRPKKPARSRAKSTRKKTVPRRQK
ncbi:MAG: hypothetical protein ONB48_04215 [candidate division KSB1 bacterium]|nr:hypothetical protein [candidate division KSB1 bacterium]MDZ7274485.1 hypothetical protein [candidate division KSB1 bacterium]MDZ7284853.1 hypothetical protein [candidate division KSB1 bacterium]MDZ7297727.1 hypothetical protein [candidate division KSB1 bacterium]MDZ7307598.1 hypothetical protein [candidate division KSB1 bacterium]